MVKKKKNNDFHTNPEYYEELDDFTIYSTEKRIAKILGKIALLCLKGSLPFKRIFRGLKIDLRASVFTGYGEVQITGRKEGCRLW